MLLFLSQFWSLFRTPLVLPRPKTPADDEERNEWSRHLKKKLSASPASILGARFSWDQRGELIRACSAYIVCHFPRTSILSCDKLCWWVKNKIVGYGKSAQVSI
jgi:hypothetical protein